MKFIQLKKVTERLKSDPFNKKAFQHQNGIILDDFSLKQKNKNFGEYKQR